MFFGILQRQVSHQNTALQWARSVLSWFVTRFCARKQINGEPPQLLFPPMFFFGGVSKKGTPRWGNQAL